MMQELLSFKTNSGKQIIEINTIIRFQASSNYTKLFFTNAKPLVVSKTLGKCEEELHNQNFIRVHQSHLINKNFIVRISNMNVIMANGNIIQMSRRKIKNVKTEYNM